MNKFTSWVGRLALVAVISMVMIAPALAVQTDTAPSTATHVQKSAAITVMVPAGGATLTPMSGSTTVYITKTGKKYHKSGCQYLKKSKIKKTVKWVKAHGYTACKVCKPPKK